MRAIGRCEPGRMPIRDMTCPKYLTCIDKAAYTNKIDLGCVKCSGMANGLEIEKYNEVERIKEAMNDSVSMREAAQILGVKFYLLGIMRKTGEGPQPIADVPNGSAVRYHRKALEDYLAAGFNQKTEVTTPAAAKILNMCKDTLHHMRMLGEGPPCRRVGKKCLYRIEDLKNYSYVPRTGKGRAAHKKRLLALGKEVDVDR